MQHIKDISQKLRSSGLRPTKQRVQISKMLFKNKETFHFSIEDLKKIISREFKEKISFELELSVYPRGPLRDAEYR